MPGYVVEKSLFDRTAITEFGVFLFSVDFSSLHFFYAWG
jgi:hypothetical protein